MPLPSMQASEAAAAGMQLLPVFPVSLSFAFLPSCARICSILSAFPAAPAAVAAAAAVPVDESRSFLPWNIPLFLSQQASERTSEQRRRC